MKNKLILLIMVFVFVISNINVFAVTDDDLKVGNIRWFNLVNNTGNITGSTSIDLSGHDNATLTMPCSATGCIMDSKRLIFTNAVSEVTQTMMVWFVSTDTAEKVFITQDDATSKFMLEYAYPTASAVGLYAGGSASARSTSGAGNIGERQIIITYNNGYVNHFLNGTNVSNPTYTSTSGSGALGSLGIGRPTSTNAISGTVYAIAFWNRTLSQSEITYLYGLGKYYSIYSSISIVTNYTIFGNITYNSTAFANANISLINDTSNLVFSTVLSNSTGGYSFRSLSNNTWYLLRANYRNITVAYATASYVYMNDSVNITKNMDFSSTGTSTTIYPSCFVFSSGCFASTTLTSNSCAVVGR